MEKLKEIPMFIGRIAKMGNNRIIRIPDYLKDKFEHKQNVIVLLLDERLLRIDSNEIKERLPFINYLRKYTY